MLRTSSPLIVSTLLALSLSLTTVGCKKAEAGDSNPPAATAQSHDATAQGHGEGHEHHGEQADLEGRPVVDNWKAQVGDVTVCPISGKKFEVKEDAGHFSYQGYDFVFCCAGGCLDKVAADPGKYLDKLVEQAGGPASDPDKTVGDAVDDG